MSSKITPFMSIEETLLQSGELLRVFALEHLASFSFDEQHSFLERYFQVAVKDHNEKSLESLIQILRRLHQTHVRGAYKTEHEGLKEADKRFRKDLERLFWELPDCRLVKNLAYTEGSHAEPTLEAVKILIFTELLREWTAEPTEVSIYAFRRAIAMGWPERKGYRQRGDELDVEMKARGRYCSSKEATACLATLRKHLDGYFAGYDDKKKGPDAVFGPWLRQQHVPEEVQKLLVIARAREGGEKLANRDLRFADILDGLPESGLERIKQITDSMRRIVTEVDEMLTVVQQREKKRGKSWEEPLKLQLSLSFLAPDCIHISIGGGSKTFGDLTVGVETMRDEKKLSCGITLEVRDACAEPVKLLSRTWSKV